MSSRSGRAETRSRTKDDLKRVMQSVDKVRRWEKHWVTIAETTMKIHKWIPLTVSERKRVKRPIPTKSAQESGCATPISANNEDSNFSVASDTQETTSDLSSTPTNFTNAILNKNVGAEMAAIVDGPPPQSHDSHVDMQIN